LEAATARPAQSSTDEAPQPKKLTTRHEFVRELYRIGELSHQWLVKKGLNTVEHTAPEWIA